MKILTNKEYNSLSDSAKAEIKKVIKQNTITINEVKKRIKSLAFHTIDYRLDTNMVKLTKGYSFLLFRIWEKTDGEQWGNCAGREIIIKVGTHKIRAEVEFFSTNNSSSYNIVYITFKEFDEIFSPLEGIPTCKDDVDKDHFAISACKKILKICSGVEI